MKKYFLFLLSMILLLASCEKFKTDAVTGREFLLRQGPTTQHFGSGVTEFTGANGMSIKVHEPFISLETGDTLSGNPEFSIVEYSDKTDMLFAGLPTVSANNLIVTGGAFRLTGFIEGEAVRPSSVEFFVPAETENVNMQAFVGETSADGEFDWLPVIPPSQIAEVPFWWADTSALGSGGSGYQGFMTLNEFWYSNESLYINCDYFLDENIPLTDVSVRPSSESNFSSIQISVSMLFQTENAYMQGNFNTQSDMYEFYNVPIGYEVTCLGVGVDNNQELYFGMLDLEVEENGVYTFTMEPITEQELEDILDGL